MEYVRGGVRLVYRYGATRYNTHIFDKVNWSDEQRDHFQTTQQLQNADQNYRRFYTYVTSGIVKVVRDLIGVDFSNRRSSLSDEYISDSENFQTQKLELLVADITAAFRIMTTILIP